MTTLAVEATVWDMETHKTVIATGGGYKGPYSSELELGILPSGRIAGMRFPGTSGTEQVAGGYLDGLTLNLWAILWKGGSALNQEKWHGGVEFTGMASDDDPDHYSGSWEDTHGNAGTFTMTKRS